MENVNYIFKFIPSSYIKKLLEIVVKLKIKICWPKEINVNLKLAGRGRTYGEGVVLTQTFGSVTTDDVTALAGIT